MEPEYEEEEPQAVVGPRNYARPRAEGARAGDKLRRVAAYTAAASPEPASPPSEPAPEPAPEPWTLKSILDELAAE